MTSRPNSYRPARGLRLALIVLVLSCASHPARAEPDPYLAGRLGVSLTLGTGQVASETYYTVGAGLNYFLLNGLWFGATVETRQGLEPTLYKASPEIGYVLPWGDAVRPYVGAFYRRIWVENYSDYDTLGARAGVQIRMTRNVYWRIGGVYESLRNCDNAQPGLSCSDQYGEFGLYFGF